MNKLIPVEIDTVKKIDNKLQSHIIILKEKEHERYVHIWTGPYEGTQIVAILKGTEYKRPLANDLVKSVIEVSNLQINHMEITKEQNGIYYCLLVCNKKESVKEKIRIDCRPTDAINLALKMSVPIYIESKLLDRLGKYSNEITERVSIKDLLISKIVHILRRL